MKLFSLLRLALLGSLLAGISLPAAARCTRVSPAIDSGCDACGVGVGLGVST